MTATTATASPRCTTTPHGPDGRGAPEGTHAHHEPAAPHAADRDLAGELGWILPDGRFFACDLGGHAALARALGQGGDDPDGLAERLGWAKVGRSISTYQPFILGPDRPTARQKATALSWCLRHGLAPRRVPMLLA